MTRHYRQHGRAGTAIGAALAVFLVVQALAVVIPGDPADGEIRFDTGSVNITNVEHRVGHGGTNGTELLSSIYLFELPAITNSAGIFNAALLFTHNDNSGSFTTNPANADVYGLGYVSSTAISTNWHFAGASDTRTGNDLGTGIGANPVVRIADDILTPDSDDPGAEPHRIALADAGLTTFLKLIYDQGASAGDYAVVRINIDEPASTLNRRYDIASADDPDEANRPELRINHNTVLVYDPFDDGDRTDGADPRDTGWYYMSSAFISLSVTNDFDGGGLYNILASSPAREFGAFPRATLNDVGDFIRLSMQFRAVFLLGADEAFRIGLYDSGGTPIQVDGASTGSGDSYKGVMVKISTGGVSQDFVTWADPVPTLLGGSGDFMSRHTGAPSVMDDGTIYSLALTITRSSTTGITVRAQLQDTVLVGEDPGSNNSDGDVFVTFDSVVIGSNPSAEAIDIIADNIRVETSVFGPVPSSDVVANAMELVFTTQPGVRYGLSASTDMVSSNWNGTGYAVTGDGGPLRAYDVNPAEASKSYRLTD